MKPRISMVSLGGADLERAARFYAEGLGLLRVEGRPEVASFASMGVGWG